MKPTVPAPEVGIRGDTIDYIENNPVKAGLYPQRVDWEFSSARARVKDQREQDSRAVGISGNEGGQDARGPGER
jgi:hypothetical protein